MRAGERLRRALLAWLTRGEGLRLEGCRFVTLSGCRDVRLVDCDRVEVHSSVVRLAAGTCRTEEGGTEEGGR